MSTKYFLRRVLMTLLAMLCLLTALRAHAQSGSNASFVSQAVPTSMLPGGVYNVSVSMTNTGTSTWSPATNFRLGSQNPADNSTWGGGRVNLSGTVGPGQTATFSFQVYAPTTPGTYNFQWRMLQEGVEWFGALSPNVAVAVSAASGDTVTYIHTDGLGSPIARSDATGHLISRTRYEPYGLTAAGAVPTIGFAGHVNDADTGLVYMQQRYYDPVAGRFLSIDPVTTDANTGGSFNRYAYASNRPYKYVDPDGRSIVDVAFLAVDLYRLGSAVAAGEGVGAALVDVGISALGVASPVPFVGEAMKGARAVEHVAQVAKVAEKGAEGGRAANKLRPVTEAEGAHSTFKRGSDGKITNTATYTPNPKNPSGFDEAKRVDVTGKAHTNSDGTKVDTPHVHEAGVKDVRFAKPEELPSR